MSLRDKQRWIVEKQQLELIYFPAFTRRKSEQKLISGISLFYCRLCCTTLSKTVEVKSRPLVPETNYNDSHDISVF